MNNNPILDKSEKSFRIFGKTWYAGLMWRHESAEQTNQQIKKFAVENGYTHFIRAKISEFAHQTGWQSGRNALDRTTAYSLAMAVKSLRDGSWFSIYPVGDDLFWYIAVRDQEILPNGDMFGTFDEVYSVRSHHESLGEWKYTNDEGDFLEVLEHLRKIKKFADFRIRNATRPVNYTPALIGLASMIAVSGALLYYKHERDEKKLVLMRAQAMAAQKAQLDKAKIESGAKLWERVTDPALFMHLCELEWKRAVLFHRGWRMTTWECRAVQQGQLSVTTKFSSEGGLAIDAPGQLDDKGGKSTLTSVVPIPPHGKNPSQGEAGDRGGLIRHLYTASASTMSSISIVESAGNPKQVYKTVSVSFSTVFIPFTGIDYLQKSIGYPMTIDSLSSGGNFGKWMIGASFYYKNAVKPQPQPQKNGG